MCVCSISFEGGRQEDGGGGRERLHENKKRERRRNLVSLCVREGREREETPRERGPGMERDCNRSRENERDETFASVQSMTYLNFILAQILYLVNSLSISATFSSPGH